jgi:hypothetical protein
VGRFLVQAKPLERFRLWNAILVKALIFIEFINHLLEFFAIDDPSHDIDGTPATRLIKVTVIEHITFFEIFSGQPLPEVKQSLHHVRSHSDVPDIPRGELQSRVVVKNLGPIFKIWERGTQKGGVILTNAEAIHTHIAVLMPEDLPWLANVFCMF